MKKLLIPILLMPLAFTSCKKHQIKKETKRVAGSFRGQMERYIEEYHVDSSKYVLDKEDNSVSDMDITIEKIDDDAIMLFWDGVSGVKVKYEGHNIMSTYHYYSRYSDSKTTIIYYPATDSVFIVGRYSQSSGQPPWSGYSEDCYFKGKRVSD